MRPIIKVQDLCKQYRINSREKTMLRYDTLRESIVTNIRVPLSKIMGSHHSHKETLWALKESSAIKVSDPAYQRAVKYLLGTQWEDGSWYVRSRAPKFQPYFQSGFPFDHDQWISSVATSWAVGALAPAIETEKRASR